VKKIVLGLVGAVVVLLIAGYWGAGSASADNGPHIVDRPSDTDACAGCHRAHTGQAAYLLKAEEFELCTTCHDGTNATTNVLDGVLTGAAVGGTALRGGGFENAMIDTDDDSWRFSVQCDEGPDAGTPWYVPGYPTIVCTDGDGVWGETGRRVTFTGTGTVVPAAPDVSTTYWDATTYKTPAAWPLHINVGVSEPMTSNHTLDVGSLTVWGSGASGSGAGAVLGPTTKLECSSCHNPHGNNQYRILRPNPASTIGLAGTYVDGVTIPDACPAGTSTSCVADGVSPGTELHDYTTENYMNATYVTWTTTGDGIKGTAAGSCSGASSTNPGCPDGSNVAQPATATGMSAWCAQCHQRYLTQSSSYDSDSGDAIFAYRHTTRGDIGYNGRQCITCHVAHGTNAKSSTGDSGFAYADSFPWPDGTAGTAGENSRLLKMDNRGICLKCHKRP